MRWHMNCMLQWTRFQNKEKIVMACPVFVSCGSDILNVHTGWIETSVMRVPLHIDCVQCSVLFCTVQVCIWRTISIVPKESQPYWTITHATVGEQWVWVELATWNTRIYIYIHIYTHTHTHIHTYQVSFPLSVQNFSVRNKRELELYALCIVSQ